MHGRRSKGTSRAITGSGSDRLPAAQLRTDQTRRFPVVYLLHGYGGRDDTFTPARRLQEAPTGSPPLRDSARRFVMPNAFTLHKGSMYSNSVTTGDWERYITKIVAYIDSHYRTIPEPHEPWAGRSFDGRLRRAADRDEATGGVRELVHDECVLPDREPQPEPRVDVSCGSDQDSCTG